MAPEDLPERLQKLIDHEHVGQGCWIWQGALNASGYSRAWVSQAEVDAGLEMPGVVIPGTVYGHRLMWSLLNGPVATGHDLDHLCRNRRCVNPGHLESVSHRENVQRSDSGLSGAERRRRDKMQGRQVKRRVGRAPKGWGS